MPSIAMFVLVSAWESDEGEGRAQTQGGKQQWNRYPFAAVTMR